MYSISKSLSLFFIVSIKTFLNIIKNYFKKSFKKFLTYILLSILLNIILKNCFHSDIIYTINSLNNPLK